MKKSGRPKKHNCDYFSHDNGMRNDRKLKAVRAKYDLQGYAIYNMILESLTESNCLVIEWEVLEIEMMAGDFGIDSELLIDMVDYFTKINLLTISNGYLFCPQLDTRLKCVFDKRNQFLEQIREENGISVTETHISVTETTQSKVKESEVKQSENIYSDFFEKFWDKYPGRNGRKIGKSETFDAIKKYVPIDRLNDLDNALDNYIDSKDVKNGYAKDPKRFIKNRDWSWEDWLQVDEKPQTKGMLWV